MASAFIFHPRSTICREVDGLAHEIKIGVTALHCYNKYE